jgi:hypothetical protein
MGSGKMFEQDTIGVTYENKPKKVGKGYNTNCR